MTTDIGSRKIAIMSKLRGLEKDDPDVRYSKTLAYLLRHGAEKQGLPMRKDGYVRVVDIVSFENTPYLALSANADAVR